MELPNTEKFNREKQDIWDKIAKSEESFMQKMAKVYDRQNRKLEKEISDYFSRYGVGNVIEYKNMLIQLSDMDKRLLMEKQNEFIQKFPEKSHLIPVRNSIYKLDRLQGLNVSVLMNIAELGIIEEREIYDHLEGVYGEAYAETLKKLGISDSFNKIDEYAVEYFINEGWYDGLSYIDSVWSNKDKLVKYLNDDFKDGMIRGESFNDIFKKVSERFDKRTRSDLKKTVFTNGTRVANEAMMTPFTDVGLYDEYKYLAVIDNKTTHICRGLNGERFRIQDREPYKNFPPMHSYCRSYFNVIQPVDFIQRYERMYADKYV